MTFEFVDQAQISAHAESEPKVTKTRTLFWNNALTLEVNAQAGAACFKNRICITVLHTDKCTEVQSAVSSMTHFSRLNEQPNKQLSLTCLFLSSVILWIWIFFLPMMLCCDEDKCCSQSSAEVPLGRWERKCSHKTLRCGHALEDTHRHISLSSVARQRGRLLQRAGAAETLEVEMVLSSSFVQRGLKWQTYPPAAVVRMTTLLSCEK